jgi:hypothetical protein
MPMAGAVLSRTKVLLHIVWAVSSSTKVLLHMAWVLVLVALAGPVSAHRLDEYLQAARIGIDPDRVQIELDLTPGVSVAPRILAEIDRDHDGAVSREEARAYEARVTGDLHLDVDGHSLALEPVESQCRLVGKMLKGEGTLSLQWVAEVPALTPGTHRLRYRNGHHADIGVYLANALVPASTRVAVTAQRRDVDQRELVVEYELGNPAQANAGSWLAALAGGFALFAGVWRRSHREPGTVPRDP